jgi:hypothetical protein
MVALPVFALLNLLRTLPAVGQTLQSRYFTPEFPDRLGRIAHHGFTRCHVAHHTGFGGYLGARPNSNVIRKPDLSGEYDVITNGAATGKSYLRNHDAPFAKNDIVANLNLIIDAAPGSDNRIFQGAAVNRCVGPNLNIFFNHNTTELGHFAMPARNTIEYKAKSVLPDADAGMNNDIAADQARIERHIRPDAAIFSDQYAGANHRSGSNSRSTAYFSAWSYDRSSLNNRGISDLGARVHNGT